MNQRTQNQIIVAVGCCGLAIGGLLGAITTQTSATAKDCEVYQSVPNACETNHSAQSFREYGQEWLFVASFRELPNDPESGRIRGWQITKRTESIADDGVSIWIPDRIVRIVGGGYVE